MIYLKFINHTDRDHNQQSVYCCKSYQVAGDKTRTDVYYEPGMHETLSRDKGWLNCFVMSETGKTIDVIHAP